MPVKRSLGTTHGRRSGGPRRGFTLIELLVVVAVIAVLLSILLPALSLARRSGQTIACLSNMRGMQMSQVLYANDHQGQLVDFGLGHGAAHDEENLSWFRNLQEYYDSPLALRSPLDKSPHWPAGTSGPGGSVGGGQGIPVPESAGTRFRKTSYGINEHVSPRPPFDPEAGRQWFFDKLHRIQKPTVTAQFVIMAFEGAFAGSDHIHVSNWFSPFLPPDASASLAANMMQVNAQYGPERSMEARSNYSFLDGHASTMMFREVYESPMKNKFDPRFAQ